MGRRRRAHALMSYATIATMDSGTLLTRWTNYSGDFRGATAPLGSFPQTTSSPPISTPRISIFIMAVGPAPLMQDQIPILVMVCPSRKQRPAFPYQCPGFGSQRLQVVAQNPRGLPHHRQSAVVQCLLPSRGAASLDYRASHVSAYLLRGFRSLMPFVQLVNSVPTPFVNFLIRNVFRKIRGASTGLLQA